MHKDGALCTETVCIITIGADHDDDDDDGGSLGRQEKDDSYRLPMTGFRVTRSQVKRLILLHGLPAGGFMIIVYVRQSKTRGGSVGGYPIDIKLTNARPVSLNNKRFSFVVVVFSSDPVPSCLAWGCIYCYYYYRHHRRCYLRIIIMFYLFVRTCNARAIMIYTSCGSGDTVPHKTRVGKRSRPDHGGGGGSTDDRRR